MEALDPKMVLAMVTDPVDNAAVKLIMEATGDPNAGILIKDIITFTATYDHIVDEDDYTKDDVHEMVDILLRGLILNPFYVNHITVYVPIIMNAIHAWRYADTCPEYRIKVSDILSEMGCAMLYLSGGAACLQEWGNKWRDQINKVLEDSDGLGQ